MAWAIAGALAVAAHPAAGLKQHAGEVSVRLDRLTRQISRALPRPEAWSPDHRDLFLHHALNLSKSGDPVVQRKVLGIFMTSTLATQYPPVRIVVNYEDLARIDTEIHVHPSLFAYQLLIFGTGLLFQQAPSPPGRYKRKITEHVSLVSFLVCLADALILRKDPLLSTATIEATEAGFSGTRKVLGRLQVIYFLVDRALSRKWGWSLKSIEADYRGLAQTYLYPHRGRHRHSVGQILEMPEAPREQALLALGLLLGR
jgi:hypothetical protein